MSSKEALISALRRWEKLSALEKVDGSCPLCIEAMAEESKICANCVISEIGGKGCMDTPWELYIQAKKVNDSVAVKFYANLMCLMLSALVDGRKDLAKYFIRSGLNEEDYRNSL